MLNRLFPLAICAFLTVGLAACKINPREPEYSPKVGGNTFDLQNSLDVTFPDAQRINISYEYVETEDGEVDVDAPGIYDGTMWWYQERTAEDPEQFIGIHLLTETGQFDYGPLEAVTLSRTDFVVQNRCIDLRTDALSPDIAPYIDSLMDQGFNLSSDLYVRRFILRDQRATENGFERTDIVYVHDLVRSGYTCKSLGDLNQPSSEVQAAIQRLKDLALEAFEMMT